MKRKGMFDYDLEDGHCSTPSIYEKDYEESSVLDRHGRPFLLTRPFKIGFDLKNKGASNER